MPRGPAPSWGRRQEPILDHLIHASVSQAGGKHDDKGRYAELVYTGCSTRTRAEEIKRALYRCARYIGYSMAAWIEANGEEFDVHFRANDKAFGKKHVIEKYGPDRSKWPYDPRRKGKAA